MGDPQKLLILTPGSEDQAQVRAAQILAMLVQYRLVSDAWLDDGRGFGVRDGHGTRHLSPEEVLDEYGDRIARMVEDVMEHSNLTTTEVSVPVGAQGGPVPYIADVGDRVTEYARYWPT